MTAIKVSSFQSDGSVPCHHFQNGQKNSSVKALGLCHGCLNILRTQDKADMDQPLWEQLFLEHSGEETNPNIF